MTEAPAGRATRLLVIGIDAASPALLDRWIADGSLPHLAALVARGLTGRTQGVEGFFIGATWPSLYTGTTPATHGVHYLLELEPGTYTLRHSTQGAFVRRPPFWRALVDAGQRVAVLDVPLTRLDAGIRGVQVVEWGGHDALYGFRATPPAFAAELLDRYGPHPGGPSCDADGRSVAEYVAFLERLEQGVRRKGAWTRELLAQGGWDLFMQVFTEGHCAGHQCWHLHDPTHPGHDAATAAVTGDPLLRVYRAIDAAIGDAIAAAGDTRIVVFSAHGMAHWYGAQFLLQDILVRLGAAAPLPPSPPPRQSPFTALFRPAWRLLPERWRAALRPVLRRAPAPRAPAVTVDVSRSRCFPHPNGLAVGGIRLNIAGREPAGLLQPGAETDAFVEWLTVALREIVDERTGRPLVHRVLRTATRYQGECLGQLPDLLVEWSDEMATGSSAVGSGADATVRASSPLLGTVEGVNEYGRTGEHRPGGWFVAAGPGIERGRLDTEPALVDLAPTFAALLGVQLPACEGRVIEAIAPSPVGPAP